MKDNKTAEEIHSFDKSMSEMFRQHDYRAMYEYYEKILRPYISQPLPIEGGETVTDEKKRGELLKLIDDFTGSREAHSEIFADRILKLFSSNREAELLNEIKILEETVEHYKSQWEANSCTVADLGDDLDSTSRYLQIANNTISGLQSQLSNMAEALEEAKQYLPYDHKLRAYNKDMEGSNE